MRKVKNKKAIIISVVVPLILVASMLLFQYISSNKVVTVAFDTDGGSSIATQFVNIGKMVSQPVDPVKEGYSFLFWELDGKKFDFSNPIISDIELHAKWETDETKSDPVVIINNRETVNNIITVGTKEKDDMIAPVITLLGKTIEYLAYGASYTDAGATATDDVDGNITGKITVAGDIVNTMAAGTYVVTYNVSDTAGNPATVVKRTIIVDQKIDVGWIMVEPTSIMAGLESFPVLIDATIYPENASNKNIVWSSSNPSLVSVVDGEVTIQDNSYKGIVIITATTIDGNKTAITIVSNNISAAETRAFWSFNEVYRSDRFDKLDFTKEEDLRYMGDMLNSDRFDSMAGNLPPVYGKDIFLERFTSLRTKVNVAREPFDILQIDTAKELIADASYTMTQEAAIDEAIIKSTIEGIIEHEISAIPFYNEVVVTVNKVDYTPAVAADAVDSAGIDGTYTLTVDLRMLNSLASGSIENLTMTITAAPFVERIK